MDIPFDDYVNSFLKDFQNAAFQVAEMVGFDNFAQALTELGSNVIMWAKFGVIILIAGFILYLVTTIFLG